MGNPYYAVVEHNQASGQPDDQHVSICWNLDEAVEHADSLTAENRANGRRERFVVYTLEEVDESELWNWATRKAGTDERPMVYVHEYAARRCLHSGYELLKQRLGTKEWTVVPPDQDGGDTNE